MAAPACARPRAALRHGAVSAPRDLASRAAPAGRAALRVAACAACRRVSLIPWPLRPAPAAPAATQHGGASGAPVAGTRLRSLPWLAAAAASAPPDDAALDAYLDKLKWDDKGLLVAIAQNVDTGAIMMQAFANRQAVKHTLTTGKATFWTRSRQQLWTKGETSNNYINVTSVHVDCDGDSLIYMGVPDGPACHTNAETCYFTRVDGAAGAAASLGGGRGADAALSTLMELEATVAARAAEAAVPGAKPSWTRRLLDEPALLCSKVREEAGELCATLEGAEGAERAASEAADLLYHATVLLRAQGVGWAEVMAVLRRRQGVSGVAEKAARPPKK